MANNKGKQFERKFKEDWLRTIPGSFLFRLQDSMGGYAGIANPCDFIGYSKPNLFLIECKAHKGNTWPITDFRQYDKLISYDNLDGVFPGVLLWFEDHDKVIWVPIKEIKRMKEDDKKSINIKMLEEKVYNIIEVPSVKRKVYMDSDYSFFMNIDN